MAGCSLDFTVRPQPADGGSSPEAGADADAGDRPNDAGTGEAGDGSPLDADAAVDCDALELEVKAKLDAARACTLASGHCTTTVKDQCNCDVVIAVTGSPAASDYEAAVTKYKASTCALGCGTCPSTANRNCLQKGGIVECYPP